jgi:Histidine phosphatase superfamily (branch 2)
MVPHRVHHHHFHYQYKRIISTRSSSIWNLRRCGILHRSALQQPAQQQHLLHTTRTASLNQPTAPPAPSPPNYSSHQHAADYRHNDGLVEGVWIFCRHGDRTPGRALSPAHRRSQEGAFWVRTLKRHTVYLSFIFLFTHVPYALFSFSSKTSKLPFPDSTAAYEAYCRYFPPEIFPGTNQGRFLDTPRNPFGFLTQKGLGQLKESGHRFFNRYNHHGFHRPDGASNWQWGKAEDFLSVWNVKAYSTNYLRTILSAQSFLDGVLGTHCFIPTAERIFDPDVCEELRLPDHEWKRGDYGDHELVKIHVRELSRDPLNAFDRNPDLMADLVAEVMSGDQFQSRDSVAAPLAARLANILPGLYRPKRSNFASRSPSKINWVEAGKKQAANDCCS